MKYDKKSMRERFAELTEKRATILAIATPLRDKLDKQAQKAREAEEAIRDDIAKAEKGLFEIDQERAMISRALGGKTSEPEPEEPAAKA